MAQHEIVDLIRFSAVLTSDASERRRKGLVLGIADGATKIVLSKKPTAYAEMTSRRSSGSMRADSAFEPTKSENITVTWRRSARSSGDALGGAGLVAKPAEGPRVVFSAR